MIGDGLRQAIRESSAHALTEVVLACRQRFLEAAALLEWRSATLDHLRSLGIRPINVWSLMPAYQLLGDRYIDALYSPQRSLLPGLDLPDEQWGRYFHHHVKPLFLENDEVVRNFLRAVGGLPASDPQAAAESIIQFVGEMTLPQTSPIWAPDEIES
jgi:hypothetical protein